ncbi:hypothetical protein [Pleionea sp. CnH1-48]|uniref:hypothetical protein n=1 Tax=Pleionea sp. CnH1-48 TaxID=2954494 RepID=UPI00209731BF|nr:hypothetical protein [Pleionea sp. CnH1-48]MCO7223402.1 hypothetical protein [Pleionea sp. CnH1-48]
MELDDLKQAMNDEKAHQPTIESRTFKMMTQNVDLFNKKIKRHFIMEVAVAIFSFVTVMMFIIKGDYLYPMIIEELFPSLVANGAPQMNIMMYAAMSLMALYCLVIPVKLYLSLQPKESMSWTLSSRINNEIELLEQQNAFWSRAHLWSLIPATVIGVSFFWGLQYSLLGSWVPGFYLCLYFAFIAVSMLLCLWLKNHLVKKEIGPLLKELYITKSELNKVLNNEQSGSSHSPA